jgi:CheY-like chemotaxis protein
LPPFQYSEDRYVVSKAAAVERHLVNAPQNDAGPLSGARILVIEDVFLIATVVEDVLKRAGAREVVIALSPREGRDALTAAEPIDAAVIDIQLAEGTDVGFALAEVALKRSIPIVFLTGYESDLALPEPFSAVRVLTKPCSPLALIQAVNEITSGANAAEP